jgi:hypothetical protein
MLKNAHFHRKRAKDVHTLSAKTCHAQQRNTFCALFLYTQTRKKQIDKTKKIKRCEKLIIHFTYFMLQCFLGVLLY